MTTMLPAVPKTFGILKDVFKSAHESLLARPNKLRLPRANQAVVVLVDGLGFNNLKAASGHARFLASLQKSSRPISCAFPSTTASSITSFATGTLPGQHRFVGYQVKNLQHGGSMNLLNGWSSAAEATTWQNLATVSETARADGLAVFVVGSTEYSTSGFTAATMRGATYVAAKTIEERKLASQKLLSENPNCLIYFYVPELDQAAHKFGMQSSHWLALLEELDFQLEKLCGALPAKAGLIITADHGIVNVNNSNHIYLDEFDADMPGLTLVAGDPRVAFLYFDDTSLDEILAVQSILAKQLSTKASVVTLDELVDSGWYPQSMSSDVVQLLPQLFVLPKPEFAVYHRKFAKRMSLQMIGQHGGMTQDEMLVPLLLAGAYETK
jgi:predicted AlkP superfamily pyrophosphatase or phosphodiesterase